ncbi:hypothetical protein F4804DRAFT_330148 [Jackrogersella minutella]|nr:hypothetical protein F4804DRAFT_330148 [Jackrogersella minutella]
MQFSGLLLSAAVIVAQGNCLATPTPVPTGLEARGSEIMGRQDTIVWEGTCTPNSGNGRCKVPKLGDEVDCESNNKCKGNGHWCSYSWETLEVTCL